MNDREKKQDCPKCGSRMKYRGSHMFLCIPCGYLWEKTEGEWIEVKNKKSTKITKVFDRKTKGWKLFCKTAKR